MDLCQLVFLAALVVLGVMWVWVTPAPAVVVRDARGGEGAWKWVEIGGRLHRVARRPLGLAAVKTSADPWRVQRRGGW